MNPIPITHYFTFFQSLGGVQSLLRRHVEKDASFGLDSNIEAFFDSPSDSADGVRGLGLSWRSTVWSARRAFSGQASGFQRPFAIYNNFWGLPFFADLDGAERRIAVLHSYAPVLRNCLDAEDGLVDGVLCVSRPLMEVVYRHLPSLDHSRVALLPLPVSSCPFPVRHQPIAGRPLRIGLAGRLQKEQKRVDRLPAVVAALEEARIDYRLELLGAGPSLNSLRRQFSDNPRVALLGHRTGQEYWKALTSWDAILFTSDYEGLPLSLLEAMSAGVLPVYPRIQSGGDGYASGVGASFLYETGDFQAVANALRNVAGASGEQLSAWREKARQLAQPHLGDSYHETFSQFVRTISKAPRVSTATFPRRRFYWSDHCPFGILVRTWLRGFYRRNDR